jgi:hypothetical protein
VLSGAFLHGPQGGRLRGSGAQKAWPTPGAVCFSERNA